MNAERLRGIIDFLLTAEKTAKIQDQIVALRNQLDGLVGNPADQNSQKNVATALAALESSVSSFVEGLSPAQQRNIAEVKAHEYFSTTMVAEITAALTKNGITPAVVQQQVHKLQDGRQKFLDTLRTAQAALNSLGVQIDTLAPGEAEIGFMIPRALFDNNLGEFQKELKVLNSIIRTFHEVSGITPGPIPIRQISTTDPVIFLGMAIKVLIFVSKSIKWCSDTIKATMHIKGIVEAARAAALDKPVIDGLEEQIQKKIDKCVQEKVAEILNQYTGDAARKNELKGPLEKSLNQLLERVANGMTVEIRLLPPAKQADPSGAVAEEAAQFEELKEIAKTLDFPQIPPGQPMLQITREQGED